MGDALVEIKEETDQVRLKEKGYLNELEILRKKT